jgi:hypothetical protein
VSTRGIYVVAFGNGARQCALRMMQSAKRHMPDIPIALGATDRIGPEDVFIPLPDSDVGARRAKLRAYEVTPPEWQSVLYLDADTEIVAPVYSLFEWCEDGWEFVICRDVGETLHSFQRKNNMVEFHQTERAVGTLYAVQFNGGVWAFRRSPATDRFMKRWRAEYEVHLQRDQGALVRALYSTPLRILVLGNEWNTMPAWTPNVQTAGILHYPMGRGCKEMPDNGARRWVGKIPGRIDAADAWAMVKRFETGRR